MSQIEFEIAGVQYRSDRLNVFKQLHVSRKIGPVIPKLIPVFVQLSKAVEESPEGSNGVDMETLISAAGPFADVLAALSDDDVEYVVKTCLSVVKRNQAGAWAPMVANGTLMFSDLGLDAVLPIVARVLRENLGNFIQGLLANPPAVPLAALPAQVG